jgi:predicted transcriptional regulator
LLSCLDEIRAVSPQNSASPSGNCFDRTGLPLYIRRMEVRFTPEQEVRLSQIATREGLDPEELVKDAALRLLEDDTRFRAGVRKGLEQADRGEFIEEQEMDARVKRMFQP